MSIRKARYFDDPRALSDFVHLYGGRSSKKQDPYVLYRIVHPTRPGAFALVLFGFRARRSELKLSSPCIEARIERDRISWPDHPGGAPIVDVQRAPDLAPLVRIQPDPSAPATASHAIFWTASDTLLESLLTDSLKLGNDRIQFASTECTEGKATLLRIEQPSYYLLQRCLEDHPEVAIYYPAADGIYVTWGHRHPLEALWNHPDRTREHSQWLFFDSAHYRALAPPVWEDAYNLTDIVLDFPIEEVWLESKASPPKFEVPLTLHRIASPRADAELWRLDSGGVARLEALLQILSEDDLRPFQLSAQRGEHGEFVFIREMRAGKSPRNLDLGGIGFASYRGLPNLMLPVDFEMQPPLRRDLYRKLFDLEPGVLTVLIPDEDGNYLTAKLSEKSFQPVESLVDYVIRSHREILQHKIEESLFKFDQYAIAPSRRDLQGPKKDERGNSPIAATAKNEPEGSITSDQKPEAIAPLEVDAPGVIDESRLPALQRRELELERILVSEEQTLERWQDLARTKELLAKREDAIIAAVEALWLAKREGNEEAALRDFIRQLTSDALFDAPATPAEARAVCLQQTLVERDHVDPDQWVAETAALLDQHRELLRTKERWLLWGDVLQANRDTRKEAQLRREIQSRIVEHGLNLNESPPFIRTRIFLDRQTDAETGGPAGVAAALANLDAVEARVERFNARALRVTTRAILTRAYAQLGHTPKVLALIEDAETPAPGFATWVQLFHAQALQGSDPEGAQRRIEQLDESLATATRKEFAEVVNETRELYDQLEKIDNPAAFLSRENRTRLYPKLGAHDSNALFVAIAKLDAALLAGDEALAIGLMTDMMNLPDPTAYNDEVKLPQFVDALVRGLTKFRWSDRGAALLPMFDSFSDRVPALLTGNYHFYHALLHTSLADGLALADLLAEAETHTLRACELLREMQTELDVMDAAATTISCLEQLPFERRRTGLDLTLEAIADKFDDRQSHYLSGNPRLFAALIRVLEQAVQASISKDRISLNHFKNYQAQDEFLILQRVQSEKPSRP